MQFIIRVKYNGEDFYVYKRNLVKHKELAFKYSRHSSAKRAFEQGMYSDCSYRIIPYVKSSK